MIFGYKKRILLPKFTHTDTCIAGADQEGGWFMRLNRYEITFL